MSEVLNVDVVIVSSFVVLYTGALLANQVVDAVMALRTMSVRILTSLLSFETIVAHAEHLAGECVGHDRLARLTSHLSHDTRPTNS